MLKHFSIEQFFFFRKFIFDKINCFSISVLPVIQIQRMTQRSPVTPGGSITSNDPSPSKLLIGSVFELVSLNIRRWKHCSVTGLLPAGQQRSSMKKPPSFFPVTVTVTLMVVPSWYTWVIYPFAYFDGSSWSSGPFLGSPHIPHFCGRSLWSLTYKNQRGIHKFVDTSMEQRPFGILWFCQANTHLKNLKASTSMACDPLADQ